MKKYSDCSSQSIKSLNGVGIKTKQLFSEIGVETLFDLLSMIPVDLVDKSETLDINNVDNGESVVISGEILKTARTSGLRPNYILTIQSLSGVFTARFIHRIIIFMNLQKGMRIRVSGNAIKKSKKLELIHPEIEIIKDNIQLLDIIPKYSAKGKISQSKIRKLVRQAFLIFSQEYNFTPLDKYFNDRFKTMSLLMAMKKLHFPEGNYSNACKEYVCARQRLVLEEIYLHKHEFLKTISKYNQRESFLLSVDSDILLNFYSSLPFQLTNGQKVAVTDIKKSFNESKPSKVLIQGDVGSGKTIVAIIASFHAILNGHQCLVLVPTEILCNQHFQTFSKYLNTYGEVHMVSGKTSDRDKIKIKHRIAKGEISILVGTHALLFNDYKFNSLALVIIDEQHKFGVKQREKISSTYNKQPHLIYMSATPIPRTLALVLYESMNYITIEDKPCNRKIIKTKTINDHQREEVILLVNNHLNRNMQVYWVCTRVEDTLDDDVQSVKIFSETIKKSFPKHKVSLLHGKISSEEKINIINNFQLGKIDILVATSVIEVGVDCPNANCLVIENSELFGLAQLHQLRGRVGRGDAQGFCYLIHSSKTNTESINKLKYLENHHSGFDVAEYDLKLRGTGTYLGNRQSGMPDNYRISNINDIMDNITYIKSFEYDLPSSKIRELKKRWNIKKANEIQL